MQKIGISFLIAVVIAAIAVGGFRLGTVPSRGDIEEAVAREVGPVTEELGSVYQDGIPFTVYQRGVAVKTKIAV